MNTATYPLYFSEKSFSPEEFSCHLNELVASFHKKNGHRPILFLCIGSDRVPGDCLGPLVGYKLERLRVSMPDQFTVCGSLAHPVHAVNLRQQLRRIQRHEQPYLTIAIDASIGCRNNLGMLCLSPGSLCPGEGVSKSLPPVGQISITGVTSCEENPVPFHRQNIPLSFVMNLADQIYQGLFTFLTTYTGQALPPLTAHYAPDRMNQNCPDAACTVSPCRKPVRTLF